MAEIVPAILTNDLSDFRKKYAELFALSHNFSKLHIDFADGQFVPNKTLMPADLSFFKSHLTLMAHFMCFNPQQYFLDIKSLGFKWVLMHFEAFEKEEELLSAIEKAKSLGLSVGLVINPETPLYKCAKILPQVQLVQLMGIHPGFQGKEFIAETLFRIRELRSLIKNAIISVDGGIDVGIAKECVIKGAQLLVVGSAILQSSDEAGAINALKEDIKI